MVPERKLYHLLVQLENYIDADMAETYLSLLWELAQKYSDSLRMTHIRTLHRYLEAISKNVFIIPSYDLNAILG